MAQPNLSQSARKITIIHNKLNANNLINLGPIKGEKLKTVNFDPVNKFRSSPFHQLTTNNLKRKCSTPGINAIPSSSTTDSFNEKENMKNVVRWLETLPNNQDWCKLEEDSYDRQGDFGKEKTSQAKNNVKFDTSQPSTSCNKNPFELNRSENHFSTNNETNLKKSPGKVKFDKMNFHFETRRENSRHCKLPIDPKSNLKNNSDRVGKMKNLSLASSSRIDNMRSLPGYKIREENVQTRRHSYNLRNLEFRKNGIIDPRENITRTRRSCSIRCQEGRRRGREISSSHDTNRNEGSQKETLNPQKLKSPFTKQARSNTPSLLSDLPHLSSFNLNELKEMEECDKASDKQKQFDKKVIIKTKLENNKKLINAVKEKVNHMNNNQESIRKSVSFRKSPKSSNEKIINSPRMSSKKSCQDLRRNLSKLNNSFKSKPAFANSKLEEKLNLEMETTVNNYKRSRKTGWLNSVKKNFDKIEEPPEKKKKLYCKT